MSKIYGYVRVSSVEQNEDRQLLALTAVGVANEAIYKNSLPIHKISIKCKKNFCHFREKE